MKKNKTHKTHFVGVYKTDRPVSVIPPCQKTVSENHLWVKLGGNIPEYADLNVCLACGMVDDTQEVVDKPEKK